MNKKSRIFIGISCLSVGGIIIIGTFVFLFVGFEGGTGRPSKPIWPYSCEQNICKKLGPSEKVDENATSFDICRLSCGLEIGTLWPKPKLVKFDTDLETIDFINVEYKFNADIDKQYWNDTLARFEKQVKLKVLKNRKIKYGGKKMKIDIVLASKDLELSMSTKEDYKLEITNGDDLEVFIRSSTFYGARYALETLEQLIAFDEIHRELKILSNVKIEDEPKFKHRGVMLDTSRNYFTKEAIMRTIDGMAMVKMNVFHWHITDSDSFSIEIKSHPELTNDGTFSEIQIYSQETVKEIVEFAKMRGIRVIPEIDGPAHTNEGWQQHKDLLTCLNYQPWKNYCAGPPCGQLNPSKKKVYDILEDIYGEIRQLFSTADFFHLGGDEVNLKCWNASSDLQDWMKAKDWGLEDKDFMKLWGYFQEKALESLDKGVDKKIPVILWTSSLTEEPYLTEYLDKERYIIQVWTKGDDSRVKTLLEKGYKLILSNYDALYLDCGFSSTYAEGNNWCSPYNNWENVYDNQIEVIAGKNIEQILGAEVALWSEQVTEATLDSRLWPRVSALAERLWSDPTTDCRSAQSRMLMHSKRLRENGIKADRLKSEWCLKNEFACQKLK